MINHIEQMMETAGVEKHFGYYECHKGRSSLGCPNSDCKVCDGIKNLKEVYKYPVFTAEKQLEIIKLIGKSTDLHYFGYGMSSLSESTDANIIEVEHKDFTQALAQLTTELMKAGELDKEKVKEILQ